MISNRHWRPLLVALSVLAVAFATASTASFAAPDMAVLSGHVIKAAAKNMLVGRVASSAQLSVDIVLPLRNQAALQQQLHDIYTPGTADFGHYLTSADFIARYAPTQDDYDEVAAYFTAKGLTVDPVNPERTLLAVSGSASALQSALSVTLNNYTTPQGRAYMAPTSDPVVPATIASRVVGVIGLETFNKFKPHYVKRDNPLTSFDFVTHAGTGVRGDLTPSDVRTAYNLVSTTNRGDGQTVASIQLDGYNKSDIDAYYNYFAAQLGTKQVPITNILLDSATGAPGAGDGQVEVCLDIQMQMALAPNAAQMYVYIAPNSALSFIHCFQKVASDNAAPAVSCSWGLPETYWSSTYLAAANQAFLQMGLQGQSFYAAAGDFGAYDEYDPLFGFGPLSVDAPASCPNATGVGGTTLATDSTTHTYISESTWGQNYTTQGGGGGISAIWPIPAYQKTYQLSSLFTSGQASTTSRNVPDISLNSDPASGYSVYSEGQWMTIGGTSAAAPLWAGFTALVNQARSANKLGTLGFANATLYPLAVSATNYFKTFHDIADNSKNLYYSAVPGYDPATGLGTFNGGPLLTALSPALPLTAPTGITATNGSAEVDLSWPVTLDGAAEATSYNVYRSTSASGPFNLIGSAATTGALATQVLYRDSAAASIGGDFYYKVSAVYAGSGESALVNAIPFPIAVPAPTPSITSITPNTVPAGSSAFTMVIIGSSFIDGAKVDFGSNEVSATWNSSTQLTTVITPDLVAAPGSYLVDVNNFGVSGKSDTATFIVTNPTPVIKSLSPAKVLANSDDTTVTIKGSGFYKQSSAHWIDGATNLTLTSTVESSTQMTVVVPKAQLALVGPYAIRVDNPTDPTPGGPSSAFEFDVANPSPVATSMQVQLKTGSPTAPFVGAGTDDFTLIIHGTGFIAASEVYWTPKSTGIPLKLPILTQTSTQITASVLAAQVAAGDQVNVTVVNPTPTMASNTSSPLTFVITNATPTLNSLTDSIPGITPNTVGAGSDKIRATVSGSKFVAGATLTFNGIDYPTTYVNPTTLFVDLPASAFAIGGYFDVTASNPTPGGGKAVDSNGLLQVLTFTVVNQIPVVSTISPTTKETNGDGFTLTVTGSKFVPSSTINFDGGSLPTTYVSDTSLTTFVPTKNLTYAHDATITVVTGVPGGGTSNVSLLTIENPVPALAVSGPLSPTSVSTGAAATQVTLTGKNFMATSTAVVNGDTIAPDSAPTTVAGVSTMLVTIPAKYFTVDGAVVIKVFNPAPGGGITGPVNLNVTLGVPSVTAISPTSATVGTGATLLTVTGSAFVSGKSVVQWNGTALATTYVSATKLTATITPDLLTSAGAGAITVANSTTDISSPSLTFNINNLPATLASLSPTTVSSGSPAFTLTLAGANFVKGATVTFAGTALTPDVQGANSITVPVTAALVSKAGTYSVIVTNPAPGGGASLPLTFKVSAAYSFPAGLQMISAPYDYSGLSQTFKEILGLTSPKLAVWQPGTSTYAVATNYPADKFRLGQGYWARFPEATPLVIAGTPATKATPFNLTLAAGWNQIADPFTTPITLENTSVFDQNGVKHSWSSATSASLALVSPYIYSYDANSNGYVQHSVDNTTEPHPTLTPYVGYWLLANQAVRLQFPAP
ncbi:MAG TPA: protease pro-enzyme activation domain-containing protein [Capsulimonadaceae bacterium]|jgi:kumamolisin